MTQYEIIEVAKQAGINYRELSDEFATGNGDGVEIEQMQAFAKLVAAKEREHYEGVLIQICVQCRSNEWGPTTYKKEILNWFHDFASNALARGEA